MSTDPIAENCPCGCDCEATLARANAMFLQVLETRASAAATYAAARSMMADATELYREATEIAARALFEITPAQVPN